MLIDSNIECSTLPHQSNVHCADDLTDRLSIHNQVLDPSIRDRLKVPLIQTRSSLSRQNSALSDLQALQQAADLGEQQKRYNGSIRKEAIRSFEIEPPVGQFAAPLSPLRERDLVALSNLFLTDQMIEIEADVAHLLIRLQPEPCWEDNPLISLQEFFDS
jgi:hypothetical protein